MEKRIFIIMNEHIDERLNIDKLQTFLDSIFNESFIKLLLIYQPGLRQFTFEPEFDKDDYTNKYSEFVANLQNSEFGEYFLY